MQSLEVSNVHNVFALASGHTTGALSCFIPVISLKLQANNYIHFKYKHINSPKD